MRSAAAAGCLVVGAWMVGPPACAQTPSVVIVEGRRLPDASTLSILGDSSPPTEVPWTVHVIDEALLRRLNAARIEDALLAAGVATPGVNQAGLNTAVVARGFDLAVRLHVNGHPDLQRMFVRDLATVGCVEVLKGHYAILYGQGAPGATINYVGKRPAGTGTTTVSASVGNFGLRRVEADLDSGTGAQNLRGRLVVVDQRADTWQPHVANDQQAVLSVLSWAPAADTTVRLEAEWMRNHRPYSFGTVHVAGRVVFDRSYVAPAATSDRRYARGGLYADHRLAPDWSVHFVHSAGRVDRDETLAGFFTIASPTTLSSYYRELVDRYRQQNAGIELRGRIVTEALTHRLSVGLRHDAYRFDFEGPQNIGGYAIDIDSPVLDLDFGALPLALRTASEHSRERSVYIQDRVALGEHWHVVAGARRAQMQIEAGPIGARRAVADQAHTATALGVVHAPSAHVALHVSHSEAYEPNRGADRFGAFIAPRESRQWEAGVRLAEERTLAVTASAFRITQSNLTMPDPLDRTALVAVGEVRASGLELTAQAAMAREVAVTGALTRQRVRNVAKTSAALGDELPGVPRRFGHLGLRWDAAPGQWQAWANVVFVGRRQGDLANGFVVAGYERLDVGVATQLGGVEIAAHVANARDTRYVEAITAADNVYQGDRRRVSVTARVRLE